MYLKSDSFVLMGGLQLSVFCSIIEVMINSKSPVANVKTILHTAIVAGIRQSTVRVRITRSLINDFIYLYLTRPCLRTWKDIATFFERRCYLCLWDRDYNQPFKQKQSCYRHYFDSSTIQHPNTNSHLHRLTTSKKYSTISLTSWMNNNHVNQPKRVWRSSRIVACLLANESAN